MGMTKEEMDERFLEYTSMAVTAFWKDAYPILADMVFNLVPQAMYYQKIIEDHPDIDLQALTAECLKIKSGEPSLEYQDVVQQALQNIKAHEDDG